MGVLKIHAGAFRWVLKELFLLRLRREKMRVVMLTLDTMVMDNDEALQREGCGRPREESLRWLRNR